MSRFQRVADRVADAVVDFKERERALRDMENAWELLDSTKTSLQRGMRESGRVVQDMPEEVLVVRALEKMCYDLSGLKRAVAGFGRK